MRSTGDFAFQVQMRAFHFEKALMEEHFNESYVGQKPTPRRPSRKHRVVGSRRKRWQATRRRGRRKFDIHGVTQPQRIEVPMQWMDGAWNLQANFEVTLADHNIVIPAVVKDNISPVIAIDVAAQLMPR